MRAALAAALLAAVGTGCAASPPPWKVSPGREGPFAEAEAACRLLTDEAPGFERCMKRRGWRRENLWERIF